MKNKLVLIFGGVALVTGALLLAQVMNGDLKTDLLSEQDQINVAVQNESVSVPAGINQTHFEVDFENQYEGTEFYKSSPKTLYKLNEDGSTSYDIVSYPSFNYTERLLNGQESIYEPVDLEENDGVIKKIVQYEVYPGIDKELISNGEVVDRVFVVHPNGDSSKIRVKVEASSEISLGDFGQIVFNGKTGYSSAAAFQMIGENEVPVEVSYKLISRDTFGYVLGSYDDSLPLYIK